MTPEEIEQTYKTITRCVQCDAPVHRVPGAYVCEEVGHCTGSADAPCPNQRLTYDMKFDSREVIRSAEIAALEWAVEKIARLPFVHGLDAARVLQAEIERRKA